MHVKIRETLIILGLVTTLAACGGGGGGGGGNAPPIATLTVSSSTGFAPLTVTFDASQSRDVDGSISSYSLHTGDGSSYVQSQINHTYTGIGPFTATLTVTDNEGATSSTTVRVDVHAQIAGFYTGQLISNVDQQAIEIDVIVGANQEVHAYDWVDYIAGYWGDFSVSADTASGRLTAEIWDPAFTFLDGSSFGTVNVDVFIAARQSLTGTYLGTGDQGTVNVQYIPEVSERPSSLADVSGSWEWSDPFFGDTGILVIDQDGVMTYTDTVGCTGQGQLAVIDPALNGFAVRWTWNCPPDVEWSGPSTGLAFIDDYWDPGTEWLMIADALDDGSSNDFWGMYRVSGGITFDDGSILSKPQNVSSRYRRPRMR